MHQVLNTLQKYFPNQRLHPAATPADWAAWLRAWRAPDLCRCGGGWVRRKGRRGAFEGCSRYPDCRSTRPARLIAPRSTTCPLCREGVLVAGVSERGNKYHRCDGCGAFAGARPLTPSEKTQAAQDKRDKREAKACVKAEKVRKGQRVMVLQLPVEGFDFMEWGELWAL